MFAIIKKTVYRIRQRVRQKLSLYSIPVIHEPPVWQYPEGMTIRAVSKTGVRIVDNLCSDEEAAKLIDIGRAVVKRSTVIGAGGKSIEHDHRTSSDTIINLKNANPGILAIVYRAASLFGLPISHAETFSLAHYAHNEYYKSHLDHDGSMKADRLYTCLLYLNDLTEEEGGGTLFEKLNLVVQPVCGRAVLWVNSDIKKNALQHTVHSSLAVLKSKSEKWVAQVWFRSYKVSDIAPTRRIDQPAVDPLTSETDLPSGITLYKS
jgi:hypothetical protein